MKVNTQYTFCKDNELKIATLKRNLDFPLDNKVMNSDHNQILCFGCNFVSNNLTTPCKVRPEPVRSTFGYELPIRCFHAVTIIVKHRANCPQTGRIC